MTHPTRVPRRPRLWPALALTVAAAAASAAQLGLGLAPAGSPLALLLAAAGIVPVAALAWLGYALRSYERATTAHLQRRLAALEADHKETVITLTGTCYEYRLRAQAAEQAVEDAAAERAADPVLRSAVETYAPDGKLAAVPPIREIKRTLRCGQDKATRVQAYLSEYAAA